MLKAGSQHIELLKIFRDKKKRKEGVISHITFAVDDMDKEITRLLELGVKLFTDQPREVADGLKIFFFTGPSGESIEFLQIRNRH